jgi:uncharacterized membrane protein
MWSSVAELHAALNDFPPALFVASVVFDFAGHFTKRESFKNVGYWTLIAAGIGTGLALITGLRAEDIIEHGSVMHRSIERHETLAILFSILIAGLIAWRTWRRNTLARREWLAYLAASVIGLVGITWTAKVGGRIMFHYAGGIQTSVLRSAIVEREAGHVHAAGEEHSHGATDPQHTHEDATGTEDAGGHQHE